MTEAEALKAHGGEVRVLRWSFHENDRALATIAGMIAPYPTLGEVSKRAAGTFFTPRLFSDRTRRLVRLLAKLG